MPDPQTPPENAGSKVEESPEEARQRAQLATALVVVLGAASLASVYWSKIAVVTGLLTLVAWLSLPSLPRARKTLLYSILAVSVLASTAGFFRFVLLEAIPGVIAGGQAAVSKHTIAYLRIVVAAQDRFREHAPIDPDKDGIGSAGTFAELSGLGPLRQGTQLPISPLHLKPEQLQRSPQGELIAEGAYLFQLCLPLKAGGFSADPNADFDEELAERRYLLYAWPRGQDSGAPNEAYFADEHETIRVLDGAGSPGESSLVGPLAAPSCDVALPGGQLAARFRPWKDKLPRAALPGDPRP